MNSKFVSALLTLSLLMSAGITAGAQIAVQDSHLDSLEGSDADAEFGTDVVEVNQNDTATIPIVLNGTDTATVRIGSESVNFVTVVTVTDGDEDGTVTLQFDTATAETDERSVWIRDLNSTADAATIRSKTAPDAPPLAVGSYPLSLYLGNTTADDSKIAVGTMVVKESKTTATTTTTEPTTRETTNRETTENPMQSTTATETETSAVSDPETGIPGFSAGVAVLSLALAAMLAARR